MARSGECEFLYQIERQLKAEGYRRVEAIFEGDPTLRKTLREVIGERRAPKPAITGSRPSR